MELSKNPALKKAAWYMVGVILGLAAYVVAALGAIFTPPAHAKDKKEVKRIAIPASDPVPFDPERTRMECVKKRSVKKCEMMVELLQNLDDIKKKAATSAQ